MEYGRYVGRVGALAVALGIGVAVANGGVANATEDPDPSTDTSQNGGQGSNPNENTPPNTDPAGTPAVGAEENSQSNTGGTTTLKPHRPKAMILDVMGTVVQFGTHRAAGQGADPDKQQDAKDEDQKKQQAADDPNGGAAVVNFSAPVPSGPTKPALPSVHLFQRTLSAITAPPVHKIAPAQVLPGGVKTASVVDTLTTQTKQQAAAIIDPSTLLAPSVTPVAPKPGQMLINILSSIGLRPDAFPPSSPLAPIGQVLEFVYAGLRRFDHTFFNETPTATPLIINTDEKTGVVTGRVATDYEGDALKYKIVDAPDDGQVVLNPDGTFTYTPNRDETHALGETDQFTVVVSDDTNFHLHLLSPGWHTTTVTVSDIPVIPNNTVIATTDDPGDVIKRTEDLAINHAGTLAYVTDSDANKVHVIDIATGQLVDTDPSTTAIDSIDVGASPDGVTTVLVPNDPADPSAGTTEWVYVASFLDDKVTAINASTYATTTIDLGPGAGGQQVASSPDGTKVYVTGSTGIYTIDTATNTVDTGAFVSLKDDALDIHNRYDIAITPDGQFAYVPDFAAPMDPGGDINVVDLSTGDVDKLDAQPDQFMEDVVVSPDGRYAYITGESLIVVDTTTNTVVNRNTDIGDGRGLAISPDGSRLYVAQINSDKVTVVDTQTLQVVGEIPVDSAWNIAITPDGTRAVAIGFATPNIYVIALQTPTDPATVV